MKMKLKIEFVMKETGECVIYETTLENPKITHFVYIKNPVNDEEFVYSVGGFKIWRPIGNIICGEQVALESLKVEVFFE